MRNKHIRDIEGVVKRQKRYSTLAKKEADYALKKEAVEIRRHMPEMAKDSANEARIANFFAKKRKKIAENEEKKLHRSHKNG